MNKITDLKRNYWDSVNTLRAIYRTLEHDLQLKKVAEKLSDALSQLEKLEDDLEAIKEEIYHVIIEYSRGAFNEAMVRAGNTKDARNAIWQAMDSDQKNAVHMIDIIETYPPNNYCPALSEKNI